MYTSAHVFILYDKNKINQKEWHVATNSFNKVHITPFLTPIKSIDSLYCGERTEATVLVPNLAG